MNRLSFNFAGAFWKAGNILTSTDNPPYIWQSCDESQAVITLGIGSETGFDTSYRVSHSVGKHIVEYICHTQISISEVIGKAFLSAAEYLASEIPIDEIFNVASCTLLCVLVENDEALIGWLGNEQAYLIRGNQIIERTYGHRIRISPQQLEKIPPEAQQQYAKFTTRLATRSIRADEPTTSLPELLSTPWRLLSGDKIVLVTQRLLEGIDEDSIPDLIQRKTVSDAAQSLVKEAISVADPYPSGSATVVIEVM